MTKPRKAPSPEDALEELFDSDAWTEGLVESDPEEAAKVICDWLRDSGFRIVEEE